MSKVIKYAALAHPTPLWTYFNLLQHDFSIRDNISGCWPNEGFSGLDSCHFTVPQRSSMEAGSLLSSTGCETCPMTMVADRDSQGHKVGLVACSAGQ